ncbi:MAG: DUF3298 and DUF4163 domain-containing protein [Bacteroidales bacterium]|nr:DUF3298 and DUF4163 domain-containing protein [Bacteroidales bacterium]
MKSRYSFVALAALCLLVVTGCNNHQRIRTKTYNYYSEKPHANLSMTVDMPVSTDGPAGEIRKGIIDIMDSQMSTVALYEDGRLFPKYDGDLSKTVPMIRYYLRSAGDAIKARADADFEERAGYIREDKDLTEEQKKEYIDDFPGYEYNFQLTKEYEAKNYVVFLSEDYVFTGGAHGGVTGQGSVTFDKRSGQRFSNFIKPGSLDAMQGLLVKGLVDYFADEEGTVNKDNLFDYLFLEGTTIPFPAWTPAPTKDGLCFTYQQYEIAAYAVGMPSFTIPYSEVKPFLTAEAVDLLNLK